MFAFAYRLLTPNAEKLRQTWLSNIPKDLVSGLGWLPWL